MSIDMANEKHCTLTTRVSEKPLVLGTKLL